MAELLPDLLRVVMDVLHELASLSFLFGFFCGAI